MADEHGWNDEPSEHAPNLPAPWEQDQPTASETTPRTRHDAFTPARRNAFLKALAKSGCVRDACRKVGVSSRTIYNHQNGDAEFLRQCTLAVSMASVPVELAAWERGVVGVEEEFVCGGRVHTRLKRSDSILRLLLQGADPKKYGPRPGFTRKRMQAWERKQIERDVRSRIASERRSIDDVRGSILTKLEAISEQYADAQIAAGWTQTGDGHMIPPGWVPGPEAAPDAGILSPEPQPDPRPDTDSMCKS